MDDPQRDDARWERRLRARLASPSRRTAVRLLLAATLGPLRLPRPAAAHDAERACRKKDDKKKRKKCLKRAKRHNEEHTIPRVFEFTGAPRTYTVPAKGTLTVEVVGGEGGRGGDGAFGGEFGGLIPGAGGAGGRAGKVTASFPVKAGEVLHIEVGGVGTPGAQGGAGGFGGGEQGEAGSAGSSDGGAGGRGGGGGGASRIFRDPGAPDEDNIVIGGGGGVGGGQGGAGGQGGPAGLSFCSGFAEDGDPGVASPENLANQGGGGGGGCTFGPQGAVVGLGDAGPGRVTVMFAFA